MAARSKEIDELSAKVKELADQVLHLQRQMVLVKQGKLGQRPSTPDNDLRARARELAMAGHKTLIKSGQLWVDGQLWTR